MTRKWFTSLITIETETICKELLLYYRDEPFAGKKHANGLRLSIVFHFENVS